MRLKGLFHKVFGKASENLDKRIKTTLSLAMEALSEYRYLSLTGLGRTLDTTAKIKHSIKRMDRLLNNDSLQKQKINYYEKMALILLKNNRNPIIIVDWSGLTHCGQYHFLCAALPVGGRALPILSLAFPLSEYGSQQAHQQLVNVLKSILPKNCQPIVITDAGFRCPWFKLIRSLGWDFIGRVRHHTQFSTEEDPSWKPIKILYEQARSKVSHLFHGLLAKANPLACEFYLIKEKKKNRVCKNLAGKKIQSSVSKKHQKRESEPWLLVSSLTPDHYPPHGIINIYKKRMQIEEFFRDLKNTKNGFGLRHCRSAGVKRLNIILLIGALAIWILWILGSMVKEQKKHFEFQANTIRNRNVLSCFTIGWQFVRKKSYDCSHFCLVNTMTDLSLCLQTF